MTALTAITPTVTGTTIANVAVTSSDTIDQSVLGQRGCHLTVINGNAASDTVTITDASKTGAGNSLPSNAFTVAVPAGTSKVIRIRPEQVDPATGLVTILHSVTATVTYQLVAR